MSYESIGFLPRLCCCRAMFNRHRELISRRSETEETTQEIIQRLIKQLSEPITRRILKPHLLSPLWNTLKLYPGYYESFMDLHNHLLSGSNGYLSTSDRHYIAIMASSLYNSSELMGFHQSEFLDTGGQESWIENGLGSVSRRMCKLNDLNMILCRAPWTIRKEDIQELTSGNRRGDNWCISEVIEAMTLLCHFHTLSSFLSGCARNQMVVEEEAKEEASNHSQRTSEVPGLRRESKEEEDKTLLECELREMLRLAEGEPEDQLRIAELLSMEKYSETREAIKEGALSMVDHEKYSSAKKERIPGTGLGIGDFPWPTDGYALISRLHSEELARIIDKKRNRVMNCDNGQSWEDLRLGVQRWVKECLHASEPNENYEELLNGDLKSFVHNMITNPEKCDINQYNTLTDLCGNKDRVHLCLLISEVRFHVGLAFALKAVATYFMN